MQAYPVFDPSNLTFVVRRNGGDSVAEVLAGNVNMTGIVPGKGAQMHNFATDEPSADAKDANPTSQRPTAATNGSSSNGTPKGKKAQEAKSASHRTNGASSSSTKVDKSQTKVSKPKPKPKPKKIPPPQVWNAVPTSLSLQQAEERLHIREFLLRFASIMDGRVPKTYLDELEELDTSSGGREDESCPAWVSDMCLRAMLIGMLCLFQSDKEPEVNTVRLIFQRLSSRSLTHFYLRLF